MSEQTHVKELENVVVRFSGDSGDGMQLAGNLFSNISAAIGDEISTFPDYPAEIRAPQGTLGGVSGFQVHIGKGVYTPGDKADVLVAMNPAALKTNVKYVKSNGVILFDTDSFEKSDLEKAAFKTDDPFKELGITQQLVPVAITSMVKSSLAGTEPYYGAKTCLPSALSVGCSDVLLNRPNTCCKINFRKNRRFSKRISKS